MKIDLETKVDSLTIKRFPYSSTEKLQAWDASDEYLLNFLAESQLLNEEKKVLIFNDTFGALTLSLSRFNPDVMTDSFLALEAIKENANENNLNFNIESFINSTSSLSKKYDLILIKLPKNTSYLEDFLSKISSNMDSDTKLITTSMAKHVHTSTLKIFENFIGETKTSLAVKKARLIFSQNTNALPSKSKYPKELKLDDKDFSYTNHSNVFSREKLDIGTRFFLENLPSDDEQKIILDLGCGNGLVGTFAASQNKNSKIIFIDESFMAIESAKLNFLKTHSDRESEYLWANCLDGFESEVDTILCNPPFHQNNVIGDHIAWKMFTGSHRVLKKGGTLRVIGNRHLNYHIKLKKIFGNCKTIATNKKFSIVEVTKN